MTICVFEHAGRISNRAGIHIVTFEEVYTNESRTRLAQRHTDGWWAFLKLSIAPEYLPVAQAVLPFGKGNVFID